MSEPTKQSYVLHLGLIDRWGRDLTIILSDREINQSIGAILELHGIEGATVTQTYGLWKGVWEPSITIYVSGVGDHIKSVCADLAERFEQESVGYREAGPLSLVNHPYA